MRISYWSSDVCSSDLLAVLHHHQAVGQQARDRQIVGDDDGGEPKLAHQAAQQVEEAGLDGNVEAAGRLVHEYEARLGHQVARDLQALLHAAREVFRSEEHTSELQSLMRTSYAVFCLKK